MLTIHSDPRDIARAYEQADTERDVMQDGERLTSPVLRAYWALERYVNLRYQDALEDGWCFKRRAYSTEPHLLNAWAEKRLDVYDQHHGHPAWSDETNYRFRAVHDVYGHIPQGDDAPFTYAGEVQAATQQARDIERNYARFYFGFGDQSGYQDGQGLRAIRAAFTEIVGQAAYFEVHGRFPAQKAALILAAEGY